MYLIISLVFLLGLPRTGQWTIHEESGKGKQIFDGKSCIRKKPVKPKHFLLDYQNDIKFIFWILSYLGITNKNFDWLFDCVTDFNEISHTGYSARNLTQVREGEKFLKRFQNGGNFKY